jgi:PAS domain S-box-containing protein
MMRWSTLVTTSLSSLAWSTPDDFPDQDALLMATQDIAGGGKQGMAMPEPDAPAPIVAPIAAKVSREVVRQAGLLAAADSLACRYAPAHLVIDQDRRIVALSSGMPRHLVAPHDACGSLLLDAVTLRLRGPLAALLDRAEKGHLPVRGTIPAQAGHHAGGVDLVIERLSAEAGTSRHHVVLVLDQHGEAAGLIQPDSEARFRRMTDFVPVILFTMAPDLSIEHLNRPFYDFTGIPQGQAVRASWDKVVHPEDRAETRRRWQEAAAGAAGFEHEHRLAAADGSWRWHLTRAVPQHDEQGHVLRWFGSSIDIHSHRRAEARQRLLLTELQHRSKNILAVVRSLLSRTLESSTSLDEFAAHLSGRIGALARTQSILARTIDGAVGLEELAHQELVAHGGMAAGQFTTDGPRVTFTDKVAEIVGLALHELTTNALKYGALSVPTGALSITWSVAPATTPTSGSPQILSLVWQESGVAVVPDAARHAGFGRELIEHGLPYELGATTAMHFDPTGLRCDISFPLRMQPDGSPLAGTCA